LASEQAGFYDFCRGGEEEEGVGFFKSF